MNADEHQGSAERIWREPFFKAWVKQANKIALDKLRGARTHEDLLRAQAWHQAISELETAVRKAAKL